MSEPRTSLPGPPSPAATAKGATEVLELSQLQQSAARAFAESKAIAPHAYLALALDARAAAELIGDGVSSGATLPDLVLRAAALELGGAKLLNAAYRDGRFELYSRINVAFTVAARDSVVLPVIHDADAKALDQIAAEARELERAAGDGSITRPQLAGATFTITCAPGVECFTPVITRGQAATLGFGSIHDGVTVAGGEAIAGPRLALTLACDARIVQPTAAADFLAALAARLQEPDGL